MKKFMAVFTGTPEHNAAWDALDENTRNERAAAGMKAWHQWHVTHAAAIVEHGGPLGKTKKATKAGIADIRNNLGGFTIVQAESHEDAARLFLNHPHFTLFPGDGVEIMEIMPIPGM